MQILTSAEFFGKYHPNFPIVDSHGTTGGVTTRMSALHYALNIPVLTNIEEAEGHLLVEPFFMKADVEKREEFNEKAWKEGANFREQIDAFCEEQAAKVLRYDKGYKFLFCSEMEVLRWRGDILNTVLTGMRGVFVTCAYMQNLLKTLNIESKIVREPINESLFYPTFKKPKQIVAVSPCNHPKNTEMLIEFYRALEGKGYTRVLIGGPTVWGSVNHHLRNLQFEYNMSLYEALQEVCDVVHDPSPATFVAYVLGESEFFVNFAYHEVSCRAAHEALMAGCGVIWGQHPLGQELPMCCNAATVEEAVAALEENTGKIDVAALRRYMLKHHSFESIKKQLGEHLND